MLHKNRIWCVGEVPSSQELADKLTRTTWTLCTGFSVAGNDYLFLNDSTHEDGAGEFGILKRTPNGFVQVESVTFSWLTSSQALKYIESALAGEFDNQGHPVKVFLELPDDHSCWLCA